MSVDVSFAQLRACLARLQDALDALGTTVDEDRPQRDEVAAANYLGDAVLAARGALADACDAIAADAAPSPVPLQGPLALCHRRFHAYVRQFTGELASHDRIDDLVRVAQRRGRAWADWVGVVRQEFEQCAALSAEVADAFLQCWLDLVERASLVSVHNTVIGQQVGLPDQDRREAIAEGMT